MTTPLQTIPADSTLDEVLLAMVDQGIHHLPLTRQGRLVGMVTDTDLLRRESRRPLLVRRPLDRAAGPEELAAYAREVTAAAARLVRAGTPAAEITRFVASAHDALYVGAARGGEATLGPPPCPYALLVLGSGGRRESTLPTDQDHALVLADGAPPEADSWFVALAGGSRWGRGRSSSSAGWRSRMRTRCSPRPPTSTSASSTASSTPRHPFGGSPATPPATGGSWAAWPWRPSGGAHRSVPAPPARRPRWADRLAAGAVPDNAVPLAELSALQRRWLNDTALLIHTCQESVRIAYRTDLIG